MDYPFLNTWLAETASSENAILALIVWVGLGLGIYLLINAVQPRARRLMFNGVCLICILIMLIL